MKSLCGWFVFVVAAFTASPLFALAPDQALPVTLTGQGTTFGQATAVAVAIDILPGRCPNRLDVKSKALLPVAILGKDTFRAVDVDPYSVRLQGVAPVFNSVADLATPLGENPAPCECSTQGADGYLDLLLKFKTQDIVAALGPVANNDTFVLTLTGILRGCPGRTVIQGSDCVVIVGVPNPSVITVQVSVNPSFLFQQNIDNPYYKQIRCDITGVEGYQVRDINVGTVRLNGAVAPVKSQFKGNSTLSLWFLTADLRSWLQPGCVELTLTGRLTNGMPFEGKGSIWIWASQ